MATQAVPVSGDNFKHS